jgi:fatty acyl-CoA reductase
MPSQVSTFFADQSILLTGGTGFLGKVILEKLLRDCRDIKHIYVLLRSKSGIEPRRRVEEEITKSVVFSRIKKENQGLLHKIIPISGDITYPGLGISPSDEKILCEHVSVVFHVAATIRFDEPLRYEININVFPATLIFVKSRL